MSLIRDRGSSWKCTQELHVPGELADCFDAPADADSIVQGHAESKSAFAQCARTDRRLHPRSGFAIRGQPMIDRGWQSRTADVERLAWVLIHSGESTGETPVGFVCVSQSSVNREEAKSSTPTGSRLVAQGRPRSGRPWVDLDNLQPQRGCVPHLTQPRWGWNWRNRSSTQGFPRCGQPWATRRDPFGVSSPTIEMHIPAASARSVMISAYAPYWPQRLHASPGFSVRNWTRR